MYYSYVEIEYVATSFSPARMDLAVKLLRSLPVSLSITAIAWWTLFSSHVIRRVRRTSPRRCNCCFITAASKPGQHVGGGTPECCVCELVFKAGCVTWAAAVATCAQVCAQGWAGWSHGNAQLCCLLLTMAFLFGQLGRQGDGFANRFDGGCDKGRTDGFDSGIIGRHPRNRCLQVHGACDLSVVISIGYGSACWCMHPRNLLHVANIVGGNGFF